MTFDEYQTDAVKTVVYTDSDTQIVCSALGLNGEAGEVAEKIKKVFRDNGREFTSEDVREIEKELGDVLWYIAALCDYFGTSLDVVATRNIIKLDRRYKRGKIKGSGDNR